VIENAEIKNSFEKTKIALDKSIIGETLVLVDKLAPF
jgi:hypothetical protein